MPGLDVAGDDAQLAVLVAGVAAPQQQDAIVVVEEKEVHGDGNREAVNPGNVTKHAHRRSPWAPARAVSGAARAAWREWQPRS